MPSTELEHSFEIAAPPEEVFAHLAEPSHYVGLSPLVVAVRDVRRDGGTVHYTAVERFRFLGVVRHDNLIDVTLAAASDGLPHSAEVSGEVRSPGGVRMSYRFVIDRAGAAASSPTPSACGHPWACCASPLPRRGRSSDPGRVS